jgi:hypothetical protein
MILRAAVMINGDGDGNSGGSDDGNSGNGDNGDRSSRNGIDWEVEWINGIEGEETVSAMVELGMGVTVESI